MPTLTIKIPQEEYKKIKDQARREGYKNPSAWAQSLVKKTACMEESPSMKSERIIVEMQKTGRYKSGFLRGLKKSLEYADTAAQ
ncbi:MAG: hypothetical protein U1A23_03640 [Candidatus Sungbacteria bacterium]|nr:hypothetical protein [bacterium]MDZ4285994.1 hypothetical protein [Candidatus Sungbacteria bacterium]